MPASDKLPLWICGPFQMEQQEDKTMSVSFNVVLDPGYPPQRIHYSIGKTPASCSELFLLNSLLHCKQQVEIVVYYLAHFQGQYFLMHFGYRSVKRQLFKQ